MIRNTALTVIFFILSQTLTATAQPDTSWTARINLSDNVELFDAIEHSNGDYYICGDVQTNGNFDALLVRMNGVGDTVWTRRFNTGNSNQHAYGLAELASGNIVFCGSNGNSFLIACYTSTGDPVWNRSIALAATTDGRGIVALPDGGFTVLGRRGSGSSRDFWLLNYDQNGDTLWTKIHGTLHTDLAEDIRLLPDGGFALAGTSAQNGTNFDFTLIQTDPEGNFESVDYYGDAFSDEECLAFEQDENDDFLFGGYRSTSNSRAAAAKTDAAGNSYWFESFQPESLKTRIRGVAPHLDGGMMCVGHAGNDQVLWAGTLGSVGNLINSWHWGTAGSTFQDVIRLSDGGYIAVGKWDSGNANEGYVLRIVPPSGITGIVTDVETGEPLEGVKVSTTEILQFALTDSAGHYALALAAGTHDVVAYGECFDRDTLFGVTVEELQTIEANLTVGVPHLYQSQTSINIIAQNQVLSTGEMVLENFGSGALYYRTTVDAESPEGNWLSVNPPEGWIPAHEIFTATVEVLADTTNDAVYDFFGTIYVSTNSCPDSTFSLPVIATVLDAGQSPARITDFMLHPAYPNPFNPETQIIFDLPSDARVKLELFDIGGRLVSTPANGLYSAGSHNVTINLSAQATGIYLACLTAPGYSASRRLLFMK